MAERCLPGAGWYAPGPGVLDRFRTLTHCVGGKISWLSDDQKSMIGSLIGSAIGSLTSTVICLLISLLIGDR